MREIFVKAFYENYLYGNKTLLCDHYPSNGLQCILVKTRKVRAKRSLTALEFCIFIKLLNESNSFRSLFINFFGRLVQAEKVILEFRLCTVESIYIDANWNYNVLSLVSIRCKLEETFSLLSTLGGAYSCLGEYNQFFACKAREISYSQLRLASVWQDPSIIARCGIFVVYSLCQLGFKKRARKLMKCAIHPYISNMIVNKCCDNALRNMYKAACYRIKL